MINCVLVEKNVKMGLMSEAHKHNLNRNRVKLMKNVQSLSSIFQFLREDYTLTEEMQEEIQVTLQFVGAKLFCSLCKFVEIYIDMSVVLLFISIILHSYLSQICHLFLVKILLPKKFPYINILEGVFTMLVSISL